MLQRSLNAALRGECQLVTVSGEPGIGKTRLLDELENLAKVRQIPVLHGRFVEQNQSFPFQGFSDAIQEYFRLQERTDAMELPDFSDLANDLVSLFPMLSEIEALRTVSSGEFTAEQDAKRRFEDRT